MRESVNQKAINLDGVTSRKAEILKEDETSYRFTVDKRLTKMEYTQYGIVLLCAMLFLKVFGVSLPINLITTGSILTAMHYVKI